MTTIGNLSGFRTKHFEALWHMPISELMAEKDATSDAILRASRDDDSNEVEKLSAYLATLSFLLSVKERCVTPALIAASVEKILSR